MKIEHDGKAYDVCLEDDGTMDTCVSVNGYWVRLDGEFAADYREDDGTFTEARFRDLVSDADVIDAYLDWFESEGKDVLEMLDQ